MKRVNEEIQALVYNSLGVGKENAISRAELSRITHVGDRQVRAAIESLRHNNAILSLDNGRGYYIPHRTHQGRQEAAKWISQQNHRVNSIKAAQKGAKAFVNEEKSKKNDGIPGQISMFGEEVK